MSKSSDLLGLIIDTSLQPADDDPDFDDKGYANLLVPQDNSPGDESEDDDAYEGLRESGLSPQEAQQTVDTMRPLNADERELLEDTPGLEGLTRVDDPERQEWLAEKAREGKKSMDRVFEDASYGDNTMAHDEERMERADTDDQMGWGFKSMFKKVGRGLKKGLTTYNPAYRVAKKGFKMTAGRFMPNRDAQKAKMVKSLYNRLWFEHANWLGVQDQNAGLALKPRDQYEMVAKLWAKNEIAKQGLPTQFATDTTSGSDVIGSWWNPLSWFGSQSQTVMVNTADKRAAVGPDGQPVQTPDGMMDPNAPQPGAYDPSTDPSAAPSDPSMSPQDASQGEHKMHGWNHVRNLTGKPDVTDSLGAYAAQILGDAPLQPAASLPAKDNVYADKIVKTIALKLKAGGPMSASDLGLLSSAAKEGNVSAQKLLVVLEARGVAQNTDTSGLDPWMYKLNPSYWFASSRKKTLIDAEKKNWVENAKIQKQLAKQKDVLDEAERAAQAAQAVAAAKEQSAATETQLKEIEASLKGAMAGSFVGHEKITKISEVVANALTKTGKKDIAGKLYGKIRAGQPLDKDELKQANQIAKIIGRMQVVHGDLVENSDEDLAMHGAFVGACVMGGIAAAQEQTAKQQQFAEAISQKLASGQILSTAERNGLAKVLQDQARLHKFTASLVSGRAFVGCPEKKTWTRGAFVGAMKAMSDSDKKMLATIVKLAKLGNPRAQKALTALKQSGEIMGGTFIGSGLSSFFHYATAPIWLPAKGITKLLAPKGKTSAEQQRLNMMKSAYNRKRAAEARAAAADAQNDAEARAQQAIADAADAEADAADAEAAAKAAKTQTAEYQANPDTIPSDASGTFIGATDAELDALIKKASTPGSGVTPQQAKILAKAHEKSATGTKIRAGANLYAKSMSGDAKTRAPAVKAVKIMSAKAKKGDPQAQRDFNAVKAGRIALKTKAKLTPKEHDALQAKWSKRFAKEEIRAQKKKEILAVRTARKARVIAFQKRYEARLANKLAEGSRKRELRKLAIVERKAAKGNPKAKAFVAKRVAAAKQGDKKAVAQVRGMQLGRAVRTSVTTRRERQNMRFAQQIAKRLRKNDPKAIRQYMVWKDAAAKGNPNAIRCLQRLALAGALTSTIATGVVVLPKMLAKKGKKAKPLTPGSPERAAAEQKVALAKKRAKAGTATREELTAAAKTAHQLGDKASAGTLAMAASKSPSSTEKLKKVGNTVAAAQAGNPAAQASLDKTLEGAKVGDVDDIQTLGHVMAAKTIDAANKGEPISRTMADAINLQARAKTGDPVAQETLARVSEAATQPDPAPEATLAAAGAVGAAVLASSLANRPKARQELMAKVNPPIPAGEKGAAEAEVAEYVAKANEGTITPQEGTRGVILAQRLGKPKLAAEIAAKSPPDDAPWGVDMSSLPDAPLPPIQGTKELIKESLRALTFSTRDPLANWREGVAGRSMVNVPSPSTTLGWSPFDLFKKSSKAVLLAPLMPGVVLPAAAVTTAVASVASLAKGHQKPSKGTATTPAAPAGAPVPASETPNAAETAGAFVGSDNFKELIAEALKTKKMSKENFNKAINASAGPDAAPFAKKALGEQTLKFLQSKNVTVGGDFVGHQRHSRIAPYTSTQARMHGAFVGASDADLEQLMSKSLTDDQLDHLMTRAVQDDAMIEVLRILQKRHDLRKRVEQRASEGHLAAGKLSLAAALGDKARSGDPVAKKAFVDWCTTQSHSKSQGAFVGSADEFKQLIVAAVKSKKMSKDDFNKAIKAHVKPDATDDDKKTAGEKVLKFLGSRGVKIS